MMHDVGLEELYHTLYVKASAEARGACVPCVCRVCAVCRVCVSVSVCVCVCRVCGVCCVCVCGVSVTCAVCEYARVPADPITPF